MAVRLNCYQRCYQHVGDDDRAVYGWHRADVKCPASLIRPTTVPAVPSSTEPSGVRQPPATTAGSGAQPTAAPMMSAPIPTARPTGRASPPVTKSALSITSCSTRLGLGSEEPSSCNDHRLHNFLSSAEQVHIEKSIQGYAGAVLGGRGRSVDHQLPGVAEVRSRGPLACARPGSASDARVRPNSRTDLAPMGRPALWRRAARDANRAHLIARALRAVPGRLAQCGFSCPDLRSFCALPRLARRRSWIGGRPFALALDRRP